MGAWPLSQGQAATQAVTDPDRQGADQEGGERHDDHEGDEGDEHHLDVRGDDLLQALVDQRQDRDHQQRHEDLAAVVGQLQGQVADLGDALLGAERGGRTGRLSEGGGVAQAQEVGGEQRQDDGRADPRVDVQLLGGVVGDHRGQEVEDRAPHGVHVAQPRGNGFRAGVDDVQGVEDRQERQDQGGAEEDGQQRAERVREVLEEGVDEGVLAARLRAGGGLDVVVRDCGTRLHRRQVVDLVEDRLNGTANDDLVAITRLGARLREHRSMASTVSLSMTEASRSSSGGAWRSG